MDEQVVIVGAGPAGLAAAWEIRRAGLDPLVVDRADAVAASRRGRHDHLRLNTHRMFSHQPGVRVPRRCGSYPARDDYVTYLQEYSAGIRLRLGTRVRRINRTDGGWALALEASSLTAAHVVIATGSDAEPVLPDRRGLPPFTGAASSSEHPGLSFFGLDSSIYGNMHVHRRQARQLARAITGSRSAQWPDMPPSTASVTSAM